MKLLRAISLLVTGTIKNITQFNQRASPPQHLPLFIKHLTNPKQIKHKRIYTDLLQFKRRNHYSHPGKLRLKSNLVLQPQIAPINTNGYLFKNRNR